MKRIIIVLILAIGGFSTQAQVRVPDSDLTVNEGIYYYEGALFTGVGFVVLSDGQLRGEGNWKGGEVVSFKHWDKNGKLSNKTNYIDAYSEPMD